MLLAALEQAKVQAMFFPAGKIVDSPQGMALVEAWGRAGHRIGNHTYSHASFGSKEMSIDEFTTDVMRADGMVRKLPGWTPRESIVWSLAKQAREPGLRYPAEDDVYEKPLLDPLGL